MTTQSRNTTEGMQAPDSSTGPAGAPGEGVGGRREDAPPAPQGGGSPPSCSVSGDSLLAPPAPRAAVERDPRIEELRAMGIRREWIAVADQIGFEDFVTAWQVLASFPLDDRNRVTVPTMTIYRAFQRNQAIRTLASAGLTARSICERMKVAHRMEISRDVVRRVLSKIRE